MESGIFEARVFDTADICYKTNAPKFLGFLSSEEAVLADKLLQKRNIRHSFFGGYEDAERVYLACLPDWADTCGFPIASVTFSYRNIKALTHRDFLGALMSLGIARESVGDILCEESRAVVFLSEDIAKFAVSQLEKVGNVGVSVTYGFSEPLPAKDRLLECSTTVSSLRLDCVVASVCSLSRNGACERIESGNVSVNSAVVGKSASAVCEGDILSVRGSGRFAIVSASDRTHKGRIILKYKKYV